MYPEYDDITDRLGRPAWWDEHGCPRYCDFEPDRCGVYSTRVAFLEVGCQSCGNTFRVASVRGLYDGAKHPDPGIADPWDAVADFHYGDPPFHRCAPNAACTGVTMCSVPLRVLEFWVRDEKTKHAWERRPAHEFACQPPKEEEFPDG